jgi:ATP-binding cassette subfamily B protein
MRYILGGLTLGAFQLAMNRIEFRMKDAIDAILGPHPRTAWWPAAMMLLLALGAFVSRVASRWYMLNAGRDVEYELRFEFLRKLQQLGAAFYRKMPVGEIMSRSTSDLQQVRMLFGFGVMNLVGVAFAFPSALQVMWSQSPTLTVACLVNLPLVFLVSRSLSRAMYTRMRQNQASLGRMSDVLQANIAGVRVVRSFALEDRELARFESANKQYLDASLALARIRGSFQPTIGSVAAIGYVVFFWYGSVLLLRGPEHGGFTPGAFFAFSSAFARMTWPMIAVGFALSVVQRGRAGFARLQDVFGASPEVVDGPRRPPKHVGGSVSVEHLTFKYGERKVLDDVSFKVAPGDDARDAPRAAAAHPARGRAHRRGRRVRAPARVGKVRDWLRAARRVSLLDDGRSQHRLRARRCGDGRREDEDPRRGARGPGARGGALAARRLRHRGR